MLDQQDLQQLAELFDSKLKPINERLDNIEADISEMKEDIAQLKEDTEITREVTNSIGEWIDFYFKEDRPYPIDKAV